MNKKLKGLKYSDLRNTGETTISYILRNIDIQKELFSNSCTVVLPNEIQNLIRATYNGSPILFGYDVVFDDLKSYNELIDFALIPSTKTRIKSIDEYTTEELLDIIKERLNGN